MRHSIAKRLVIICCACCGSDSLLLRKGRSFGIKRETRPIPQDDDSEMEVSSCAIQDDDPK